MPNVSKIIKSRKRVRDLAEVFTSDREVRSMLDLVRYLSENVENTFLEPSCGNGNFLAEILKRKLETIKIQHKKQIDVEFYTIKAVASIYGVDISEDNIIEARERMFRDIKNYYSKNWKNKKSTEHFWNSIKWILEKNVVIGDMLNKVDSVVFVEYTTPTKYKIKRQEFKIADGIKEDKKLDTLFLVDIPLKSYKITNYEKLCC